MKKLILLQIDPFIQEFSKYGLLGLLFLCACYVIFYLYKSNEEKAKELVKNALELAKLDHEENKTLIKELEAKTAENLRSVELERKVEREKFYEIINAFQIVVKENTEAFKENTEVFIQIKQILNEKSNEKTNPNIH